MNHSLFSKRRVVVLGLGISGSTTAKFLLAQGAHVVGIDKNRDALANSPILAELRSSGAQLFHEEEFTDITSYDMLVLSPGIPTTHPIYRQAVEHQIETIGEVELACRLLMGRRCAAVTGTNGKTTVTLLITHVLQTAGLKAKALGNVGVPLISEVGAQSDPSTIMVLELSSYQLETLHSRIIDVGVLLNVTPDHLDRYGTMEMYAAAKLRMALCMREGAPFYIEDKTFKEFFTLMPHLKIRQYGHSTDADVCTDGDKVFFRGDVAFTLPNAYKSKTGPDVDNILAAYAVCREFGITANQFLEGVLTFKKPPHRIEFVEEKDGVTFIDDSKGTNIDAVIKAVQAVPGIIHLIAGGVDKGAPYTPWLEVFADRVKHIYAIGEAAVKMKEQLGHQVPVEIYPTLDRAVQAAAHQAKRGETVLLSPGCSSFDMFRDYAHRGEEFQRVVHEIILHNS